MAVSSFTGVITLAGDTQLLGHKSSLSPKIKQLERERRDQKGQNVTLRLLRLLQAPSPRPGPTPLSLANVASVANVSPDWLTGTRDIFY